ncbi:MAG: DegT/DnrJ/EryC1/StrS family aminotransferase [Rhodocyclaceae bacterium]|nr:DegT/DnrJ/EryC1/StrS family aminotransferase [Rhodocyclaceae bacterium]
MLLDTLIFDPSPCGFPKPRVPLLPTGLDGLALNTAQPWAPTSHFRHFARGRYALREAYRLSGIGPGSTLLAPAYHCRTMLDPALALGGNVLLYPLHTNLSPNLAALDALINQSPAPVKALLATHFFGIAQDFAALAAWCIERGITLIEDGSHAFFCEHHRPAGIGGHGEFVVSSPYKFLPSPDGGLLYARDAGRLKSLSTRAPAVVNELRGMHFAWSKAAEQRNNRAALAPAHLDAELAAIAAARHSAAIDRHELAGTSADYRPDHEGYTALRFSRMLYRHPDIDSIAQRRRDHYRQWAMATMNLPYCRPLYPELPEGCIPYMFPLIIDNPEPHFTRLKQLGVPIFRWDSSAVSGCATASDYRLHLLHLPCHQSLTGRDMDWMIAAITKVGAGETAHNYS